MVKHFKGILRYAISLALMALFLYWAFEGQDLSGLTSVATGASWLWIGAVIAITVITLALRAWRWVVLLRPFAPNVTVWDGSIALAICYTGNAVFPRLGEALRAFSLRWKRDTGISSVMATVFVERIIDLIWLLFLVGASSLIMRVRIQEAYAWLSDAMLLAAVFCAALVIGLILLSTLHRRAHPVIEKYVGHLSPRTATTAIDLLDTFVAGLAALRSPSAYAEIFVSSFVLNFGYIIIMYCAFLAFGFQDTYGLGLSAALVIMAISSLAFTLPVPGGTGPYHLLFKEALVLLYDVDPEPALACATVVHMAANVSYIVIGAPALLVQRLRYSRGHSAAEGTTDDGGN